MITGFNTDVKHDGKVFHVQTEDKGIRNPIIETLVYVGGGQILASKQYSYAALVVDGRCDETAVAQLLESQHRRMMRWINGGKFDAQGPPAFGATIISERSFDEVVLDFIRSQSSSEPIEVGPAADFRPAPGFDGPVSFLVKSAVSGAPHAGAKVTVTLNTRSGSAARLMTGAAGADGTLSGRLKLPADAEGSVLLVEARSGTRTAVLELPVTAP